jgi:hypothetical protein
MDKREDEIKDWIVVARLHQPHQEDFRTYSVLASSDVGNLEKVLSTHHWTIVGFGYPQELGIPFFSASEEGDLIYHSCQRIESEGIEYQPFTFHRSFHNYVPDSLEIVQNFILFHEAFFVSEKNEYYRINSDGDLEPVIRIEDDDEKNLSILVNVHHLRDYLAANKSFLVRYHDHRRFAKEEVVNHIQEPYTKEQIVGDFYHFELCIVNNTSLDRVDYKSRSSLLGKDIVFPYPEPDSKHWEKITGKKNKEYATFIVGRDKHGRNVKATCNESELSNYFKDRGTPHFLTPVYFKRDVLTKYYREPSRYEASKSGVSCLSIWSLELDETEERLVQAYLGDLGRIPYKEQVYWSTFNVSPRGTITKERFQRDFMNVVLEPKNDVLYSFWKAFELVQRESMKRFDEPFFLHLDTRDKHRESMLRLPVNDEWSEFEEQIQALAIITVDSLNVKLLKQLIGKKDETKGEKSLELLEEFLDANHTDMDCKDEILSGLRIVQHLRSSATSHRKGSTFTRYLRRYELDKLSNREKVKIVITKLTRTLNLLFEVIGYIPIKETDSL